MGCCDGEDDDERLWNGVNRGWWMTANICVSSGSSSVGCVMA